MLVTYRQCEKDWKLKETNSNILQSYHTKILLSLLSRLREETKEQKNWYRVEIERSPDPNYGQQNRQPSKLSSVGCQSIVVATATEVPCRRHGAAVKKREFG